MGPTREGMRTVELVEVDDAGVRAEGPDDAAGPDVAHRRALPSSARPGRRGGRRRVRRWGAVVAALAVVAGTASVAQDRREDARLAAVGDLPGALDPVDGALTEIWSSDQRLWSPLWPVDGVLVGVSDTWDGSRDVVVVGLDLRTGRTRWSTTVVPSTTTPIGGVRCVVPDAPAGGGEADRVVVCVSIDELGPDPQEMSLLEPRRARLLVLDPTTGDLLDERDVDPTTSVAALGADVVLKDVSEDGRSRVTRRDPVEGRVRWTFTAPRSTVPPGYSPVRVEDGLVLVPGEAGWVLDADGGVVHAWRAGRPAVGGWIDVSRGRVLVAAMRDLLASLLVTDLRSGRSFQTDGYPLTPTVDDGSTGELVPVQSATGDGMVAHDLGSGRPVWSVPGSDGGGVLVLDGRVVRAEPDVLRAVDAQTGATAWSVPAKGGGPYGLFTDGSVLVRGERDGQGQGVLVGRNLDDGRLRWTTALDDGLEELVEADGRLFGLTSDGTVAFGAG